MCIFRCVMPERKGGERVNVLYLVNFAGKAGIEKYVQNLTRLLPAAGGTPYFAYAIPGPLSEKLAAAGVPSLRFSLEWKNALSAPVSAPCPNSWKKLPAGI